MKSGIKTAVSLVIAVFIFGAIAVASSLGLFASVERQFYEPARLKVINEKLDSVAGYSNEYIQNLLDLFGAEKDGFLSHESVLSFAGQNPSGEALRLFESLKANCPGLEGFRIVDSAGKRVFYSSFRNDYVVQTEKGVQRRIYSNYGNLQTTHGKSELEYQNVSAFENAENLSVESESDENFQDSPRIIFDGDEQRLIFSYKIRTLDEKSVFCSAIFYVNPVDFANLLIENHVVSVNEPISLVSSADGKTGGFVFGLPNVGKNIFASEILKKWNQGVFGPDEIIASNSAKVEGISVPDSENSSAEKSDSENSALKEAEKNVSWSLISSRNAKFLHVGGIFSSEMLKMPQYVRILLLLCAFVTVCLIVVIFFNIRKDDSVVIKSKIRAIQIGLLNEYFEKDVDRKKVAAMITAQKDALTAKIKKSLGRRGKKYGSDLDVILNKSWEDIINILSGNEKSPCSADISSASMKEIRKIFEEVLATNTLKVENLDNSKNLSAKNVKEVTPVEQLEQIEEIAPVEEIPEAESVEEIEPLEEVEELQDAEPIDDAEPLEEVDDVEPLEEIPEAEPVEEPEEIELLEEIPEAEPAEDSEEIEEFEPFEIKGYEQKISTKDNSVTFVPDENCDRKKFEGSEQLVISDKTKSAEKSSDEDFGKDFVIYNPFDFAKENLENSDSESSVANSEENSVPQEEAAPLEELSSEKDGFMFTTFAENDNNVTELPLDAIVLGEDGVFHISADVSKIEMPIDEDFKKLVDSVIH